MFRCNACGSTEFSLMPQPHLKADIRIEVTEDEDVMIHVEGHRSFLADLYFMNQFAVCSTCNEIGQWAYHYPKSAQAKPSKKRAL
ncbi:MAG: hypothetical protein KC476_03795 [Cyanobacteria bacterium HKST-UBA06]|nr:hypothetical protein [Cyanobacteria bacterium HKST-UBA04]MCA9807056.1 hypothetical protein [Cyanobacteria bacterium HKST-UBA06]MCA9840648.1 hypothetical protein [Cyanobacteria bacterium HKST-UBA03]